MLQLSNQQQSSSQELSLHSSKWCRKIGLQQCGKMQHGLNLRYYHGIWLECLRKTIKKFRFGRIMAKSQTGHLHHTSQLAWRKCRVYPNIRYSSIFRKIPTQKMFTFVHDYKVSLHFFL